MYLLLKRLELQGFKSFADKTILEFVEGSTAVVGPNGSGKSNISDAIRWVIGEMSAKSLRGSNMQDVIFAGTETRKPVNFAEVSLVLDNSSHLFDINYDEVKGICLEARQKLNKHRPHSIGQASRISGVSPADISVLLVYLQTIKAKK